MTRVRVTAPHASVRTPARTPARNGQRPLESREAAQDSDVGQVFVRSLIRSQLRLALVVAGGFLLILAAFPLILVAVPGLADARIAGIPFGWLLLGAGIYPVIGLSAWLYVRTAARNEARYRDLAGEQ
ncbi:hypothetical protein QF031_002637 [Pseudarthrobacter defluvii]|uniref:hypothetical protein n=1 Tax=Pseudarthrobacter defluvii TaxID=410837 RepID=UPI00277ED07B|nr:hypothetical protein [Pseudarthrobacter defluvii]MDQ0769888.1 hypothetical protein [Pseudarthrobacter defluvii]